MKSFKLLFFFIAISLADEKARAETAVLEVKIELPVLTKEILNRNKDVHKAGKKFDEAEINFELAEKFCLSKKFGMTWGWAGHDS